MIPNPFLKQNQNLSSDSLVEPDKDQQRSSFEMRKPPTVSPSLQHSKIKLKVVSPEHLQNNHATVSFDNANLLNSSVSNDSDSFEGGHSSDQKIININSTNGRCPYRVARGRNAGTVCGNLLDFSSGVYGSDRYCRSCINHKPIVKEQLQSEILSHRCINQNCNGFLLVKSQNESIPGADQYCLQCLKLPDIQYLLDKMIRKSNPENIAADKIALLSQQKPDVTIKQQITFMTANKFTYEDLAYLNLRLNGSETGNNFITKSLANDLPRHFNWHSRYIIESFLSRDPIVCAEIMLWILDTFGQDFSEFKKGRFSEPKAKDHQLKTMLLSLKQHIIMEIVRYIKCAPMTGETQRNTCHKICDQLLGDKKHLSEECFNAFMAKIFDDLDESPLNQFIKDAIIINPKAKGHIETTEIFDAYKVWSEKQNLKAKFLNSVSFGVALGNYLDTNKTWKTKMSGKQKKHVGISIRE